VYRPHCVQSVLTTSVKILPYRPPTQLIRTKLTIWFFWILFSLNFFFCDPIHDPIRDPVRSDLVRSRFCSRHLKYISVPLKHNTFLAVYYTLLKNSYSRQNHHWHKVVHLLVYAYLFLSYMELYSIASYVIKYM